jgi:hypothetical protein
MRSWIRRHRALALLLWTALALAVTEGLLVVYYLNSWFTLPLL